MIWGWFALVTVLVAGALLWTGFQRRAGLRRDDGALAILRDQLAEVTRDQNRGLISPEEARAAEIEIKRRILAIGDQTVPGTEASRAERGLLIAASVVVPLAGIGMYAMIGAPEIQSQPFAERVAERQEADEVEVLVERLRTRLTTDETGGPTEGWLLLGQSYFRMGRYRDAADAFGQVLEREDVVSDTFSRYAESLIAAENGIVTPQAEAALDRSLQMAPNNPAAVFYKAQAVEQGGALGEARTLLLALMQRADGFYPWMETFVDYINRLGEQIGAEPVSLGDFAPMMQPTAPGPSADDVDAASEMTDEERDAFIRSMVARLAERMEDEPDDLEGWARLIQAYTVLGETERADAARTSAIAAARRLPEGDPARAAALSAFGVSE